MTEHEPIEGELVPYQPQAPSNLFGASDPAAVIERATEVATVLKDVLVRQGMTQKIQGRDHVKAEGWTTLGAMLGVTPVGIWTHELENGWEARVEARTSDGRVVGAADAMCTRAEPLWKSRDDFAIRSMAQTRAASKALKQSLGFVVTLAGFEATPAEERQNDAAPASERPMISDTQNKKIAAMLKELEEQYPKPEGQLSWVQDVRALIGVSSRKDMTKAQASTAIEWLQKQLDGEAIPFG